MARSLPYLASAKATSVHLTQVSVLPIKRPNFGPSPVSLQDDLRCSVYYSGGVFGIGRITVPANVKVRYVSEHIRRAQERCRHCIRLCHRSDTPTSVRTHFQNKGYGISSIIQCASTADSIRTLDHSTFRPDAPPTLAMCSLYRSPGVVHTLLVKQKAKRLRFARTNTSPGLDVLVLWSSPEPDHERAGNQRYLRHIRNSCHPAELDTAPEFITHMTVHNLSGAQLRLHRMACTPPTPQAYFGEPFRVGYNS